MLTDAMAYFSDELQRLDLLLHREILRLRASYQLSLDEFRGLYISDEQVNSLIDQALGHKGPGSILDELTQRAEALRANNAHKFGTDLPWHRLAAEFQLSPIEQDVLLLAVAPELEIKYETLYAYLNNDVTRKWPTCDLALRLLATDAAQQLAVRCRLLPQSTLFSQGLLNVIQPTPARPVWRASGFSLAPSVAHYVLGLPTLPDSLSTFVTLHMPHAHWDSVRFCRKVAFSRVWESVSP